jgi:hypothetical protein
VSIMVGWTLLASLVIGIAAWVLVSGFLKTWRLYHGVHLITCPENLRPAAVTPAAFEAAKWFAVSGETDLHLRSCSRWPEMAGCDQACLPQVANSPRACLVQTLVGSWYEDKQCHFCGRDIADIVWHERPPALRTSDGVTREWKDVAPEDLPDVFATADPVCWACHMVETFRRDHPEMVIERIHGAVEHHAIPPSASVY